MIKVLVKADRILRAIAADPGVGFGSLVERLGIHKATLSNILKTLTDLGYTSRGPDGGCFLGGTLLSLGLSEQVRRTLPDIAGDYAREVAESLGEVATVGTLVDGDRFNIAKATVDRTVSVNARMELRPSPYDTATGRVLLAFCVPADLDAVVAKHGLPQANWLDTGRPIRTRRVLEAVLSRIRHAGHAERVVGEAHSLAVPVLAPDGSLIASIGAAIPSFRLADDGATRVVNTLRSAAARMASALTQMSAEILA